MLLNKFKLWANLEHVVAAFNSLLFTNLTDDIGLAWADMFRQEGCFKTFLTWWPSHPAISGNDNILEMRWNILIGISILKTSKI